MNKKVMILFASAVLTASLAATGCAHGKGLGQAALPTVNHPIETTQQTTVETSVAYEKVLAEETEELALKKLAPEVVKLAVAQPDNKTPNKPAVKNAKKTPSKKTVKHTKKTTKNSNKKASKKPFLNKYIY